MLAIKKITVLYDAECTFCCRSKSWILSQFHRIAIEFIPINSKQSQSRFPDLPDNLDELVVITDKGNVYYKEKAFVMCLYALSEYYEWSFKLARPAFLPLVRNAYHMLSRYRNVFSPNKISTNDDTLKETLAEFESNDKCSIA
ncbi:hypothetical protein MNBD_GAMMA12-2688 [hydrothermal vent metagenome]|uniref:DUF393 domain-containing protein n=1 Tax=hydrothermal vent metagenome TaxID=652676 RepID=A0A3B0YGC2_9ZZZZ